MRVNTKEVVVLAFFQRKRLKLVPGPGMKAHLYYLNMMPGFDVPGNETATMAKPTGESLLWAVPGYPNCEEEKPQPLRSI